MKKELLNALTSAECLMATVIGEGRGEPIEGQVAIACSCRNRLHANPAHYRNYKDVCLEPKQYSCWNEDSPEAIFMEDLVTKFVNGTRLQETAFRQCILIAQGVYDWSILDNTNGALHYCVSSILPTVKWAARRNNIHVFGQHTFFNI